jgi:hypothetical protein
MKRLLFSAGVLVLLLSLNSEAARRNGVWAGPIIKYDTLKSATLDTTVTRLVQASLFQMFQVEVCSCSTSVTMSFEGSVDSLKWFNLNAKEVNTTFSSEGTSAILADVKVMYVRSRIVSVVGPGAKVLLRYFGGAK